MSQETQRILATEAGSISYLLRRSARRRSMEISISSLAQTRVVAPRFVSLETIERFIESRSDWILDNIKKKTAQAQTLVGKKYETGHEFLFLGRSFPLIVDKSANCSTKLSFSNERWYVRANAATSSAMIKNRLIKWYRREAGEIFGGRIFHFSRLMALTPQKITVKTQKRLWGSCNHQGKSINLNWVLVMAPLAVIDYVVVHELCHLEVPNHSKRFWDKVAKYMMDYKVQELWLKTHALQMVLP